MRLDHPITGFCLFLALFAFAAAMFTLILPAINAWELANDFPYGRACDVLWNQCEGG